MATNYEAADGTTKQLLDFGEALKMLKAGYKVRRIRWQNTPWRAGCHVEAGGDGANRALYMYVDRIESFLYLPPREDLFAEDWEVVPQESPPNNYRLE